MSDPLERFKSTSICPNCHAISPLGTPRCAECGAFHSTSHLVERVPTPKDLRPHEIKPADPSQYSLNPNTSIADEGEDDEVDDITTEWEGGSSDFSINDELEQDEESEQVINDSFMKTHLTPIN